VEEGLTNALPDASYDPQLWGFGFAQVGVLTSTGVRVFAPPARAHDAAWTTRFRTQLGASAPQAVVAGDFWHDTASPDKKAYMLAINNGSVTVYDPAETPSTQNWTAIGSAQALPGLPASGIRDYAAGDLYGQGRDQLIVLTSTRVLIYTAPAQPGGAWSLQRDTASPLTTATAVAAGEFLSGISNNAEDRYRSNYIRSNNEIGDYGSGVGRGPRGLDELCLLGGDGKMRFYGYNPAAGSWTLRRTDTRVVSGKLGAGDFFKQGRDAVAVVSDMIRVYESPTTTSGQSTLLAQGAFDAAPGTILDVTSDRLFGYIDKFTDLSEEGRRGSLHPDNATPGKGDLEVAFMERTPRRPLDNSDGHYGWPSFGESVTYTVRIKNNAAVPVAAGAATLKVWLNRPQRNADVLDPTNPDLTFSLMDPIAPFNPAAPNYTTASANLTWPYQLINQDGAPHKKLNLATVGERWVIAKLEYAGDFNRRNDRYEVSLHSWLLHPIYRGMTTFTDTRPSIAGDPHSIEYLTRKLADTIQLSWARSKDDQNKGAAIRVAFDGYFYDESPGNPDWENRWSIWESGRDFTGNFGTNWQIFNYWGEHPDQLANYSNELHETGHHFHHLGDQYQYTTDPAQTRAAKMDDGQPVQLRTHVWGQDLFSSNAAVLNEPTVAVHQHLVGMRMSHSDDPIKGHARWNEVAPAQINVKVVDRDGQPLPNASVKLWSDTSMTPLAQGNTNASGIWYTEHPKGTPQFDVSFNEPHYEPLPNIMYVTVGAGGNAYNDAMVYESDSHWSHTRLALLGRWHQNPNSTTWTFKTNYKAGAGAFTPTTDIAVEQGAVKVRVNASGTFKLYRKRPPAYERELIDTKTGTGSVTFNDDMNAPTAFGYAPLRGVYEVTQQSGSSETLPRRLTLHSVSAYGLTDIGSGKFLVANNPGRAQPYVSIFDRGAPEREFMSHYRFGHTALKVVPSSETDRFYVTVLQSDTGNEPRMFEIMEPNPDNLASGLYSTSDSAMFSRQADVLLPDRVQAFGQNFAALGANPGDDLDCQGQSRRIAQVNGDTLVLEEAVLDPSNPDRGFSVRRRAGAPGTDMMRRELSSVRGLATLVDPQGQEHVVVADPDGGQALAWDRNTAYKARFINFQFRPTGVAKDPKQADRVYVLDRGNKRIWRLQYGWQSLWETGRFDVDSALSETGDPEIGLATVAVGNDTHFAVTDGANHRVLEYRLRSTGQFELLNTYTAAQGLVIGMQALERPVDVAYTTEGGVRRLYAVDQNSRVVRVY
jgi:hypothetical protein